MTEKELNIILKQIGIPVAYDHFEQNSDGKVKPPFIVYRNDDPYTLKAENVTWFKGSNYIVELATDYKDVELENALEYLFTENEMPFDKEEFYIDEERMYQIRYYLN